MYRRYGAPTRLALILAVLSGLPNTDASATRAAQQTNRTAVSSFGDVAPIPGLSDQDSYGFSSIAQLANGDAAVFYVEQGETGSVMFISSSDDGATWSAPAIIRSGVFSPVPAAVLASGRIVIALSPGNGIVPHYSDDNGATWTTGGSIVDGYHQDMKVISNGDLVMSFERTDTTTSLTTYLRSSSSDGVAWSTPTPIIGDTPGENGFRIHDGTIVGTSNGAEVFVFVSSDATGLHLSAVLSADGTTWGSPFTVLDDGDQLIPPPALAFAPDGTTWLVYSDKQDLWYMMSGDNGATWSNPEKWTTYVGADFMPAIAIFDGSPLVTFASQRGGSFSSVWIAVPSPTADDNPAYLPPAVSHTNVPRFAPAGESFPVFFRVRDESGLADVAVEYTIGESTSGRIAAVDDGTGPDVVADDGVWSATLPAMEFGTNFEFVGIAHDTDGNQGRSFPWELGTSGNNSVGVEDEATGQDEAALLVGDNYPNPFSRTTDIDVRLRQTSHLRASVFDLLGREVARLVDAEVAAGQHTYSWDGSDAPAGVYFYRVTVNGHTKAGRMLVAR